VTVSFCHAVAVPLAKGMTPASLSVWLAAFSSSHVCGSSMPLASNSALL